MEMKDDESQTLRLRVDQISSELDKQDRVRAVNTKWMLTVGAVIVAALGYTNFVQLPREAAKAAKEQVGPKIVDEAKRIMGVLEDDESRAKEILGQISERQKIANLPIGTIAASMLDPNSFAEAVGDPNRTTWVLADGQKDITNSRYGQLSGKTTPPDLRGVFLRGMNEDGGRDPDDREPGDYQPDALQKHGHKTDALKLWRHISANTSELGYTSTGGADYGPASVMNVTDLDLKPPVRTADETRPKNVAVYFYIKIN